MLHRTEITGNSSVCSIIRNNGEGTVKVTNSNVIKNFDLIPDFFHSGAFYQEIL